MNFPIRQIAIIGAGALGSTYGSLLYAADSSSVCFIASGERYTRLKQDGVTVNTKTIHIPVIRPEEATPVDLMIVAVKYHHLDQAISQMKNAIGTNTTIISVMNAECVNDFETRTMRI